MRNAIAVINSLNGFAVAWWWWWYRFGRGSEVNGKRGWDKVVLRCKSIANVDFYQLWVEFFKVKVFVVVEVVSK